MDLHDFIKEAKLSATDIVRMTGGNISLNLASQWINSKKTGRGLSHVTKELLRCLCEKKMSKSGSLGEFYESGQLYLMSRPYKQISGVYFLFRGDLIVYVGKSTDIISRIASHRKSKKAFDTYSFIEASESEMDALETVYINKFWPEYNKMGFYFGRDSFVKTYDSE